MLPTCSRLGGDIASLLAQGCCLLLGTPSGQEGLLDILRRIVLLVRIGFFVILVVCLVAFFEVDPFSIGFFFWVEVVLRFGRGSILVEDLALLVGAFVTLFDLMNVVRRAASAATTPRR